MKNQVVIPLTIFLFSAVPVCAQIEVSLHTNGISQNLTRDTAMRITSFTGTRRSEIVYLKWTVQHQYQDGIYTIYRMETDGEFRPIGNKPGVGVPIDKNIAYYFTDNAPFPSTLKYKVLFISNSGEFQVSQTVAVQGNEGIVTVEE